MSRRSSRRRRPRDTRPAWQQVPIGVAADTTVRILRAIRDHQRTYLETRMPCDLRPMTLDDIAEAAQVHPCTVSRVRSTGATIDEIPVETFFDLGVAGTSRADVLDSIHRMVAAENRYRPLSDSAIAAQLGATGVNVTREAVTKYRGLLTLPSSRARRVRSLEGAPGCLEVHQRAGEHRRMPSPGQW